MQIHLHIRNGNWEFEDILKEINEFEGLDQYTHILPKSIQINTHGYSTSFVEKLVQIFDRPITSFNAI
jgi:hypothetical protein